MHFGNWHAIPPDPSREVRVSLEARVAGHQLIVELCRGDARWHWAVLSGMGNEIEGGTAPDANAAEQLAEEAVLHVHPPSVGDWVGGRI